MPIFRASELRFRPVPQEHRHHSRSGLPSVPASRPGPEQIFLLILSFSFSLPLLSSSLFSYGLRCFEKRVSLQDSYEPNKKHLSSVQGQVLTCGTTLFNGKIPVLSAECHHTPRQSRRRCVFATRSLPTAPFHVALRGPFIWHCISPAHTTPDSLNDRLPVLLPLHRFIWFICCMDIFYRLFYGLSTKK